MRVGVLGTLVWDRIWLQGAESPRESWGGIAYSLAAMGAACPRGWEIVPLLKIGADLETEARALLAEIPNLSLGSERVVPQPGNRVDLHYTDNAHRGERPAGGVAPWRWDELAPLVGSLDALYVNFISGEEMSLHTAERLRGSFSGTLYGDIHSLLLEHREGGERFNRPLQEWDRWIRCLDLVQINDVELATQAAHAGVDPWAFAAGMIANRPRVVAITLGEAGAWCNGQRVPVPERVTGDPTGCGDVWGSTFFLAALAAAEVREAALFAHRAAARKMLHSGASGLYAHLAGGTLSA